MQTMIPLLLPLVRIFLIALHLSTTTTTTSTYALSTKTTTPAKKRDIEALQNWASDNGILQENGFMLSVANNDDDDDDDDDDDNWSVSLTKSATKASRLLQIPSHLLWSSRKIRTQEVPFNDTSKYALQTALDHLKKEKCQYQIPQFYLALKLLREYEKGEDSLWYPWIQSLPNDLTGTAISMDEFELECLPPFAWSLATLEQKHVKALIEAVQMIQDDEEEGGGSGILSESTKQDTELIRWAFSVIFTRCWGPEDGDDDDDDQPVDIVPMGDMFNHGYPANVAILYDDDGNCNIVLKDDINLDDNTAAPLCLSYGQPTNPSRFLSIFGFVDTRQPFIFCQILVERPSQRHVDMGYDTTKMVVSTVDGSIAEEIWDVVLYSILEQVPQLQEAFYEAHTKGDETRKLMLRQQFAIETGIMIKQHMDRTVHDLNVLIDKIDEYYGASSDNMEEQCAAATNTNDDDDDEHPRLPMIRLHNEFVRDTFVKVQGQLKTFLMDETKKRQEQKRQQEEEQQ